MTAERTPKRRRRISYQGKRLTPGGGKGPPMVPDATRHNWLERAHAKPTGPSRIFIPGVGAVLAMLGNLTNKDKSREGMKPKRKG